MKRFLIGCVLALLAAVCAIIARQLWPQSHSFYTDADSIREPVAKAATRSVGIAPIWR